MCEGVTSTEVTKLDVPGVSERPVSCNVDTALPLHLDLSSWRRGTMHRCIDIPGAANSSIDNARSVAVSP